MATKPTKKEQAAEIRQVAKLEAELDLLRQQSNKTAKATIELKEKELEIIKFLRAAGSDLSKTQEAQLAVLEKEKTLLEANTKLLEERTKAIEAGEQAGRSFAESIGLTNSAFGAQINELQKADPAMSKFGIATKLVAGNLKGFALQAAAAVSPLGILSRTLNAMIGLDKMAAGLTSATGLSREFAYEAFQLRTEIAGLGISSGKLVEQTQNLIETYTDFDRLAEDEQEQLTILATKFNALGADIVPTLVLATQRLGMSTDEATELTMQLANAADDLGRPLSAVTNDFNEAADTAVFFGERGVAAVLDLMEAAERAGVAVGTLDAAFGAMSQFTQFDSASEAVGRLNAIMGSIGGEFIDTITMMTAEPAERFEIIKAQLESTGQTFEEVGPQMRLAIADGIGQPLEVVSAMFNENSMAAERNERILERYGMTAEDFDARVQDAASASDVLSESFNNMMVAVAPLTRILADAVDWFSRATVTVTDFFTSLSGGERALAGGGVVAGLGLLTGALVQIGGVLGIGGAAGAAGAGIAGALGALPALLPAIGIAFGAAAIGVLAFGGGIAMAGRGIRNLGEGLQMMGTIDSADGIVSMGQGIEMIEIDKAEAATDLIQAATVFRATAGEAQTAAVTNAVVSAIGTGFDGVARGGGEPLQINLNLDGRRLQSFIIDTVNQQGRPAIVGV